MSDTQNLAALSALAETQEVTEQPVQRMHATHVTAVAVQKPRDIQLATSRIELEGPARITLRGRRLTWRW